MRDNVSLHFFFFAPDSSPQKPTTLDRCGSRSHNAFANRLSSRLFPSSAPRNLERRTSMSTDYDSPWKEALDAYFEPFVALLFPKAHRQIDWSRGYESLDKEFQQVVREAEIGRRYVDKLVKVWTKEGVECWVLIHVEVQTTRDAEFPRRMYVYNYRVFDRYNRPVASWAVLADDDPDWRPMDFQNSVFDCDAGIHFPAVKLLDFAAHEALLEASSNPFAQVVLAHLKARQTHGDPAGRHAWKVRLVRNLYGRGFSPKDVRELFRVIDWLMELPPALKTLFWQDVEKIQEEDRMPFMTTPEWYYLCQGLRRGIEAILRERFGEEGLKLMLEIRAVHEEDKLESILKALGTGATLDETRDLVARSRTE
jgi:hypothetical protein